MWAKYETIISYRPIIRILINRYLKHEMTEAQIRAYVIDTINSPHCQEFINNVMHSFMTKGIWFFQSLLNAFQLFN